MRQPRMGIVNKVAFGCVCTRSLLFFKHLQSVGYLFLGVEWMQTRSNTQKPQLFGKHVANWGDVGPSFCSGNQLHCSCFGRATC